MNDSYVLLPSDFEDEAFALNNKAHFDNYLDLLVRGYDEYEALRLVFGDEAVSDQHTTARCYAIKRNPYYVKHYETRLQGTAVKDMWNPKLAVQTLLKIIRDSSAKHSAKLNAVKELNVLAGITIMDEAGNSRLGRSLDDFYKQAAEKAESALYAAESTTKH